MDPKNQFDNISGRLSYFDNSAAHYFICIYVIVAPKKSLDIDKTLCRVEWTFIFIPQIGSYNFAYPYRATPPPPII